LLADYDVKNEEVRRLPELSSMMYLRQVNSLASSRSWRTRRTSSSNWSHNAARPTRSNTATEM